MNRTQTGQEIHNRIIQQLPLSVVLWSFDSHKQTLHSILECNPLNPSNISIDTLKSKLCAILCQHTFPPSQWIPYKDTKISNPKNGWKKQTITNSSVNGIHFELFTFYHQN